MSKVTEGVKTIITPTLDDLNSGLVDVEYAKEDRDRFLRIFINKEGGVDLNDCMLASEKIGEAMDRNDPTPEMYYLDVTSPGVKRPLKKGEGYQDVIEQPVFVSLYTPVKDDKEWLGIPESVDDDAITMEVREESKEKTIEIPRNKIAKAHHAVAI